MSRTLALLLAMTPLAAHHATGAAFDTSKILTFRGTITDSTWLNPHLFFSMDVEDAASGNVVNWSVEGPSPNVAGRSVKRIDLAAGARVSVDVWIAKDGSHRADMRLLTLADGRTMAGQSGWDPPVHQEFIR